MRQRHPMQLAVLVLAAMTAHGARSAEIDVGDPDWSVRWDHTVGISLKGRTRQAEAALKDSFGPTGAPQALNLNAGDQNFQQRGLVSARVDVLSEFDAIWRRDLGVRLSAAGWYDERLHRRSRADNDPTLGQTPHDQFPTHTRRLAGGDAEVLDAFVFGGWRLDNGMKLTARLGRHALQYGESLFFGDNGIARAQGPIDIHKLLSLPNAQFKEVIRPVPQVSAQLQLSPDVSLAGYYQFGWEADRLPPAGSYFSVSNLVWGGSSQPEFVSLGTTQYALAAGGDVKPRNTGQFGLQLKWRIDETDLGFYYARYHDKGGQLYGRLSAPPGSAPFAGGTWYYAFPEDIRTFGTSASQSFGDFNVAGEASVRDNMPLRSTNMFFGFFPGQPQPQPATGRTAHVNLSMLATLGPTFVARESSLLAEWAWNRVLKRDDPNGELDASRSRDASALQFIFTPTYRQVLPGLDLGVPVGLRYSLAGSSAVTAWDAKGNGSVNLGLSGAYLSVWQLSLTYTHYIGHAIPFIDYSTLATLGVPTYGKGNPLVDRNFVALSVRRTF